MKLGTFVCANPFLKDLDIYERDLASLPSGERCMRFRLGKIGVFKENGKSDSD